MDDGEFVDLYFGQSGQPTPGCDCGHGEMNYKWHRTDCAWKARQDAGAQHDD